jgi:SAM-dependent methyltransferase
MGVDAQALNFLRYARTRGNFGKTLTIGRQFMYVPSDFVKKTLKIEGPYQQAEYCEELLQTHFGASHVDSLDNSKYEGASVIFDMNSPLPVSETKYDTIFDGGSLEHIFNVPQALANVSLLCKPGGQILHVLPCNNFCGHGFWQFSPELFFSLYSKENGYSETEIFIARPSHLKKWFRVIQPANGHRVNICSSDPLYVLVRTVLAGAQHSHGNIQQSDYLFDWKAGPKPQAGKGEEGAIGMVKGWAIRSKLARKIARQMPGLYARCRWALYSRYAWAAGKTNRGLSEVSVESIIGN